MDCVFGPIWLHSLDWAHHVDDTRTGILQGVRCGMNENADLDKETYHTDDKWQGGKCNTDHWSLFNEHWKISCTNCETICNSPARFGDYCSEVTPESALATVCSSNTEHCNGRMLKRDPVVYSNPFDPVLMFDGILSDVIGRDGHVSKTGNGNKNNNSSSNGGGGGDSCTKRFSFDESTTRPPDVAPSRSMVGMFERHVTRYHNHLLRMRDPPVVTSSPTDALPALTLCQCDRDDVDIDTLTSVPIDLRGAGDDVVRMARAVFSERVRLLWSDSASTPLRASAVGCGWSVIGGRWPSPGPSRRPLYIPWRMRHWLAYSRRLTRRAVNSRPGAMLDVMLVHFREMRREELASRSSSSRFVVCDAAVGGATSTRRAVINTSADRSTLSSLGCMRKTAEMSCVKPGTAELGLGHGTAAAVHDDDDETDACRTTTRLRHSFSDSDLHKMGHAAGCLERWTKPTSLLVKMASGCSRGITTQLADERVESSAEKDMSFIKRGESVYKRNVNDATSVKSNLQPCRHVPLPTAKSTAAVAPLSVKSHEVSSSSSVVTKKLTDRSAESSSLRAADQSRQMKQRAAKPAARAPSKERRRATTAASSVFQSPKKTSAAMTTSAEKVSGCCELAIAAAARRQQQHYKKKTEPTSSSSTSLPMYGGVDYGQKFVPPVSASSASPPTVAFQPPPPPPQRTGLHPAAATTTGGTPVFTAVPATGLILHGTIHPVSTRRCGTACQGAAGVLQPVHIETQRHHHQRQQQQQHVLVAKQPAAAAAAGSRVYRQPAPSAAGHTGAGNVAGAGWGYAAPAALAPRPQPTVCREYVLFRPSSVLLLR